MIKDNQQKFNRLHVVLDALVLIISYAAAFGLLILGNRVYSPHKQVLPVDRSTLSVSVRIVQALCAKAGPAEKV